MEKNNNKNTSLTPKAKVTSPAPKSEVKTPAEKNSPLVDESTNPPAKEEVKSDQDISIERIQLLHPKLRSEARAIYDEINGKLTGRAKVRFTHTLRTKEEQDELYAQGRTIKGNVITNARGGDSYHNYGLAIDICLIIDGKVASWDDKTDFDKDGIADWSEVVSVFKRYGWTWGGDWRFQDKPHFQKTFDKTIEFLKYAYSPNGYPQIN